METLDIKCREEHAKLIVDLWKVSKENKEWLIKTLRCVFDEFWNDNQTEVEVEDE